MKGIKVSDFIRPVSLNDEYPTHIDTFGQGGLHSVNTLEERNNISKQRRKEGMLVFVRENGRFFYLLNGIANSNWTELTEVIYTGFRLLENYILIGNEIGLAYQSPLLLYLKNDFLKLKKDVDDLNYLDYGAINLGNKYNLPKPIKLGAATFPLPDTAITSLIKDIPIPNPTFNPVSLGDWIMSGPWLPQIFAGSIDADLSNPLTTVSSSLAMTQIRTAKNFKLFDNANFIVANKNVSFLWDNPAYLLANISPNLAKILSLYDLGTSYTFTKAQSLGDLESGLLKNTVDNGTGKLSKAIPGRDYVDFTETPIGTLVVRPDPSSKYIASVSLDIKELLEAITILTALKIAYDLFVTTTKATDLKQDAEITALQVKDGLQDTAIVGVETSLQAEIAAIWTELNAVGIIAGGSAVIGGLDAFFNLFKTIPKGDKGDKGEKGDKGDKGDPLLVQAYKAGTAPVDSFSYGTLWIEKS
jgi:hypothetical protein